MKKGSVAKIESFSIVDGPGIRSVVFLNGCKLRCKYCHNPEMWQKKQLNETVSSLVKKLLRLKPYFDEEGGVTFSGGEPILQSKFVLEVTKRLHKEGINVALDTAGVGGNYKKLVDVVDLIIFDVKAINPSAYKDLTGYDIKESIEFLKYCNKKKKRIWIRQVVVPKINDNEQYMLELKAFLKNINVEKIELLPYHTMGISKYRELKIPYKLEGVKPMNIGKCNKLKELLK